MRKFVFVAVAAFLAGIGCATAVASYLAPRQVFMRHPFDETYITTEYLVPAGATASYASALYSRNVSDVWVCPALRLDSVQWRLDREGNRIGRELQYIGAVEISQEGAIEAQCERITNTMP